MLSIINIKNIFEKLIFQERLIQNLNEFANYLFFNLRLKFQLGSLSKCDFYKNHKEKLRKLPRLANRLDHVKFQIPTAWGLIIGFVWLFRKISKFMFKSISYRGFHDIGLNLSYENVYFRWSVFHHSSRYFRYDLQSDRRPQQILDTLIANFGWLEIFLTNHAQPLENS